MAMKKIKVEQLQPGMVFNKAVYIDMNNILAPPMVPVKEEDIKRLIKWGIEEVETAGEIINRGERAGPETLDIKQRIEELTSKTEKKEPEKARRGPQSQISDIYVQMLGMLEEVFNKIRDGVGYNKEDILQAVGNLVEQVKKDKNAALNEVMKQRQEKYIYNLGVSVSILSIVTGMSLGYAKHRLLPLATGALLHDIGMVRVPTYITEKNGPLTSTEYNRIKTHPLYGYRIVTRELELGNDVATVVLQHHEAFDGSGYPRKLKGDDISEYARIVSICDVFFAMTTKRSYRDEYMSYHAMKNIVSGSNRKFDPELVKIFLSNLAIYPVGSIVQLNDNTIGKVVSANPELPLRPRISVLIDGFGEKVEGEKIIDLQQKKSLFISKPLSREYLDKIVNE